MTPEFLEEIPSPALDSCSSTTTEEPRSQQNFAIDKPMTPAPTIVTSNDMLSRSKAHMIILP